MVKCCMQPPYGTALSDENCEDHSLPDIPAVGFTTFKSVFLVEDDHLFSACRQNSFLLGVLVRLSEPSGGTYITHAVQSNLHLGIHEVFPSDLLENFSFLLPAGLYFVRCFSLFNPIL